MCGLDFRPLVRTATVTLCRAQLEELYTRASERFPTSGLQRGAGQIFARVCNMKDDIPHTQY